MTPQEALYWCEQFIDNIILVDPEKEKMVLALQAMKQCKEALNKQIPKKPIGDLHSCPHYRCPSCHRSVVLYEDSPKFPCCQWCGQKLDWNDE